MVAPIMRFPPSPLSPHEKEMISAGDRNAVRAWLYENQIQCNSIEAENNYMRLYLMGKAAGLKKAIERVREARES